MPGCRRRYTTSKPPESNLTAGDRTGEGLEIGTFGGGGGGSGCPAMRGSTGEVMVDAGSGYDDGLPVSPPLPAPCGSICMFFRLRSLASTSGVSRPSSAIGKLIFHGRCWSPAGGGKGGDVGVRMGDGE